ncbi:ATP synthase subunit gamma, mitochondrial, putative [Plasmodium vivax]|uniref:ATP synthase subunit gamma n=6 Tax=Plasmodium vivax TaxID=5855 RepID=A5JZA4_PLAVS|nr:ATP synthase gamma chain, mitochondrial precursor, putative [Plasmodium vivax]KMZ77863.1 ATP synthase F1, gamma subunit [Plasmodium vivax India VII]KMZ84920.1 ATP synthase F1, gamma subunit [Plasmodium vivax Brazil I]KMZ90473.1 ATP synthase F1, gamma subunit [Plasmodium vivax Mauritania I]KMZ97090.1 ATP synthase F1, gamma subunit [Plasmodium vivax North Korean]EDL47315.1 ATP synthase gamma chain, mitochondrial precursor, putative [Plasmodium vivax]|eukprot:XP_001617042.1 ATP synthase gamma chain, mitochondrial precursor [Plasmodium vivax Sal-1]
MAWNNKLLIRAEQCALNNLSIMAKRNFASDNLRSLSLRMKSIKSIQKITKAMKMVAASKFKGDQRRLENCKHFSTPLTDIFNRLNKQEMHQKNEDLAIIAISSDKGLCGSVNSSVSRVCKKLLENEQVENELVNNITPSKIYFYGIGEKIRSALNRLHADKFEAIYNEYNKIPINFLTCAYIAERIIKKNHSNLLIVYNNFKSAISFDTKILSVFSEKQLKKMNKKELATFEFEPELDHIFKDIYEFYLTSLIYNCIIENLAAEQSARMTAMDNASSSATDMLDALSLKYNRARQSKITLELIEIISGANAL